MYELCLIEGYTWNFEVYCGKKEKANPTILHAEDVVMTLMKELLMAGRTLYIDNFYTTLSLAITPSAHKTFMCET